MRFLTSLVGFILIYCTYTSLYPSAPPTPTQQSDAIYASCRLQYFMYGPERVSQCAIQKEIMTMENWDAERMHNLRHAGH